MDPAYNQELYLNPELVNAVSNQIGDGGVANNGHINDHNNDHIGDFHDDVTANCLSRRRFTDAEFEERVSSHNDSQRVAYQMIVDYTRSSYKYLMGTRNTSPESLRLFITGGAGTGKSQCYQRALRTCTPRSCRSMYSYGSYWCGCLQYRWPYYSSGIKLAC